MSEVFASTKMVLELPVVIGHSRQGISHFDVGRSHAVQELLAIVSPRTSAREITILSFLPGLRFENSLVSAARSCRWLHPHITNRIGTLNNFVGNSRSLYTIIRFILAAFRCSLPILKIYNVHVTYIILIFSSRSVYWNAWPFRHTDAQVSFTIKRNRHSECCNLSSESASAKATLSRCPDHNRVDVVFQQPTERSCHHSDYSTCGHRRRDSGSAGHLEKRHSLKLHHQLPRPVKNGEYRWIQKEALLPRLRQASIGECSTNN